MRPRVAHIRPSLAAALVLLVCVAPIAAHAEGTTPMGETFDVGSTTGRIVNGTLTSAYPSVGALLAGSATTGSLYCSGTLIGCETFLTAAHCVCDSTGADCQSGAHAPNPSDYVVFLQHAGFFAVSSIAVRPDFDFPVGDVAVLKLGTPVTGIAPTPIDGTEAPPFGSSATIVGFGRDAGASDYGLKRAGDVTMAACTTGVSDATSVCWDFTQPLGPPGTDADTCNGDSGGPLFAAFQCGTTVAGITSGGTSASCLPTDHSYDANVFTYRAYIQTEGGADLANAACGAMPQAGDANTAVFGASGSLNSGTPQATHSFDVPPGTQQLRVALNAAENFGADFDLYVKAGSPPTTSDFDCKADAPNQYGFCETPSPTPGTWYVLVQRAAGSGAYQVTATTFGSGAPGSGTNGQSCDDGNTCTASDACQTGVCGGTPVANGTPCDDGSGCTASDVCGNGVCTSTPAPATGCTQPVAAGKASLALRNSVGNVRDTLTWRWLKGGATTLADFGNPTVGGGYELCVFDDVAGVPDLVLDAAVPAGANWQATGRGYKYKDKDSLHGGVRSMLLKSGDDGGAAIVVKARGEHLEMPALPLAQNPTVTVQLLGANACWEAQYGTNRVNDGVQFKAKAD